MFYELLDKKYILFSLFQKLTYLETNNWLLYQDIQDINIKIKCFLAHISKN